MRFSLRTLLLLIMLTAVSLGAWRIGDTTGMITTAVSITVAIVWAIGPKRLARLAPSFVPSNFWSEKRRFPRRSTDSDHGSPS